MSALMNLMKLYQTELLSQNLCWLRNRFYTETLFPKVNSITRHEYAQIYTGSKEFFWIIHLFSKVDVGMSLRSFTK